MACLVHNLLRHFGLFLAIFLLAHGSTSGAEQPLGNDATEKIEDFEKALDQFAHPVPGFKEALELLSAPTDVPKVDIHIRGHIEDGKWNLTINNDTSGKRLKQELVLPVEKTILFDVTSLDIIYELEAPELGLAFDLIPGRISAKYITFHRTGRYIVSCEKVCGQRKAELILDIRSHSEIETLQSLEPKTTD